MNALITYLIESTLLLVGVISAYQILKKSSPYSLLRIWLLLGFILAALLPLIDPILLPQNQLFTFQLPVLELSAASSDSSHAEEGLTLWKILRGVYLLGVAFALTQLAVALGSIYRLIKRSSLERKGRITWAYHDSIKMPFSFGNLLFWNPQWNFSDHEKSMIVRHEEVHIRKRHSGDVIMSGLMKVIFWFHPLFYWLDREIKLLHEFEADELTLHQYEKQDYLKLLFEHVSRARIILGHSVYQSPIQKRIEMMKIKQNRNWQISRIILAILILGCLGFFVACTETEVISESAHFDQAENVPPPPPPPPPLSEMEVANATADSDGDVFNVVEVMPRFPGCEALAEEGRSQCAQRKLLQYVYDNIQYPEAAKKLNIEGMVVVSFIVDESGRINDPTIVRNIGAGTGEEVIRVVNKMNEDNIRWIPGEQRGRKVKVKFNLPVKFALD